MELKIKRILSKVLVSITICGVCFVILWVVLALTAIEEQYYSTAEVLVICDRLNLDPNSAFCQEKQRNNHYTLKNTLEEHYPINQTHLSDTSHISPRLTYFIESCDDHSVTDNNICPTSSLCGEEYSCSSRLPMTTIEISFDKDGFITEYYVYRKGS